ncbi:MAG: flavodoxin [Chloroflexi bacterium]|nr:flavodoxin [Chloroflexota bacterium]
MTIGLFYGTNNGATESAAEEIKAEFEKIWSGMVNLHKVGQVDITTMMDYDNLILGVPTYNIGELQDDWYFIYDKLDALALTGCRVAIFGLGDQYGYPDTFQDGIGILGEKIRLIGGELVGFTATAGFEFSNSRGVENGQFMGLALDNDNQPDLTTARIQAWVQQLIGEFDLEPVLS